MDIFSIIFFLFSNNSNFKQQPELQKNRQLRSKKSSGLQPLRSLHQIQFRGANDAQQPLLRRSHGQVPGEVVSVAKSSRFDRCNTRGTVKELEFGWSCSKDLGLSHSKKLGLCKLLKPLATKRMYSRCPCSSYVKLLGFVNRGLLGQKLHIIYHEHHDSDHIFQLFMFFLFIIWYMYTTYMSPVHYRYTSHDTQHVLPLFFMLDALRHDTFSVSGRQQSRLSVGLLARLHRRRPGRLRAGGHGDLAAAAGDADGHGLSALPGGGWDQFCWALGSAGLGLGWVSVVFFFWNHQEKQLKWGKSIWLELSFCWRMKKQRNWGPGRKKKDDDFI